MKSNAELAGHLVFADAYKTSESAVERRRYVDLLKQAADRLLSAPAEQPPGTIEIRPPAQNEMSDAVFMCCPLLCAVGALTDDSRYFRAAVDYAKAMQSLCLRNDGIYRHWSGCDAAWGRGNGFPMIGITRCLAMLPEEAGERPFFLNAYKTHVDALLPFQDTDGAWHQVIDDPQTYAEMTCTCMIGWAIDTGLQAGWIQGDAYTKSSDAAWRYVSSRIGLSGEVGGACEGTGRQPTVEAYRKRKAIHGQDDRGGAMALLFALQRDWSQRDTAPSANIRRVVRNEVIRFI
ncbi:MAG: glycoside hydrolase family 88 protein [Pirellulaceae bacterium]